MSSDSKVILFEDLAKHNDKNDCWLLINGKCVIFHVISLSDEVKDLSVKLPGSLIECLATPPSACSPIISCIKTSLVYDVTSFLDDHPGGDEVLLTAAEKDATNEFEDVGHSDSAREMMGKYYIGEIDASSIPKEHADRPPSAAPRVVNEPNSGSDFIIKILQFVVPLLILGVAFALRSFTKKEE
ncbi:Cytochrome b5-like heme/steroid binding domain [Dillenia turbinata]|uniref:Cytochrome b5-like heme/steroid binding domain n=1 Tax=Dillenia turbinata TaxID=194707 RepID=A0AAN8UPT3_9MAGN